MSLFQCENCGCRENTAMALQGCKPIQDRLDWSTAKGVKGQMLCSACAPARFSNGSDTGLGEWHNEFEQVFLEIGRYKTDDSGNLVKKDGGFDDLS